MATTNSIEICFVNTDVYMISQSHRKPYNFLDTTDNININSDDRVLVQSFLSGNQTAFNYIVMKYQKKTYSIVQKLLVNSIYIDDVTQEVFVKLYDSLKTFRGDSSLMTYIYRIAINMSLNHIKQNRKLYTHSYNIDENNIDLKDPYNIDVELDKGTISKHIRNAINSLPEQQRVVFQLRFYDNLSYEELAEILNKPIGTLKATYFFAFKKLSSMLKNNETLSKFFSNEQ
ncbi:MAG: RNA polymerase sigma factor [Ignavibacteria bacterium]